MDTSKIIKGVVNSGRYTVTAPIIKEDYGLYLQIEGVELPSTYEVDFSNSEHNGTSVTMIGNSDGVLIPHQFIDTGKDIFAFLYHVGANYGRTVYKFRIPNKCRPDRTDDTPTPEEQSTIDQAISALNTAVAQTAEDRENADASAQSAYESADEAQQARDNAQTYANNAQASATSASQSATASANSATASAQSASQSAQIKSDVEGMVDDAQGYAQASAQSASQASASEQGCARAVLDAASAAAIARARAEEASGYAQTASAKTQDASGYASTASTKATEASQSATTASNKATEASGYATASQTAQGLAESARDSAQGYAEDAQGYAEDAQASAESISASASQIAQNTADIASLEEDRYKPYVTDSASGSIASFPDGADDIPLKSLVVDINPVQEGTGDPSPENICPISGWTGMQIQHTKKNLLPLNIWSGITYNASVGTVFIPALSDKSWTQGENSITYETTATYTAMSLMTGLLPKGTYRCSIRKLSAGVLRDTLYALDTEYTVLNKWNSANITNGATTVTLTEDGYIASRLDNGSTASQTVEVTIQVEVGDTETAYEPYNGTTLPISWSTEAGTVYGGKLDVLTGILTVYPYYASYNGETLTGRWISDRDVYAVGTTPTIGAQVVNIGAEGTEYQLSPTEVKSLYGTNNIFADTGDTSVEYRADTKLYINRLTEPDADMIADSNITSGQYFMVGNNLFKATANIASGASVIVGTNCTRKSLSEALNEINA